MGWPSSDHRAQTQSRSRRRVLQAVLGAGVGGFAGLAGCTSRGETGASTPTAAVENYFAALEAGNRQRANRYAHADGEYAIGEEPSGPLAAALDADTITIEGPNEVALETAVRNRCREVDREFQSVATVLERVTARAETYLDDAQSWLEAMPEHRGNRLSAWAIPFLLAVGTIRELKERPADPIRTGDVKVSRAEVQAIMNQFEDDATGDDIGELRDRLRRRPLHEW